jgi:hypothetical protein
MVFHMLRQTIGDEAFWTTLRDLYATFLFEKASWQDLQGLFEQHTQGQHLGGAGYRRQSRPTGRLNRPPFFPGHGYRWWAEHLSMHENRGIGEKGAGI